jgi:protein-S-isoprenylcysteine O-methyltransferase Ste14
MNPRLAFVFQRGIPLGVFGFLVAIQGQLAFAGVQHAFQGDLDRAGSMYVLNRILTLSFFTFLLVIYVIRSNAIAKDHSPFAVFVAFLGSFILYFMWLVPAPGRSKDIWVLTASDILLLVGMLWAIYSLSYLRGRFSIIPEARGLVTTGPYQLVRHPVYLGEMVAGLGLVLPTIFSLHALVFLIFVAAQLQRMRYEEKVLRHAFPDYAAYSRHTPRLLPGLF